MGTTECRLLNGRVAIAAQMTLAACILASLLYKRHREKPKRPLNIWLLDVSKQGFSATTCHIINMTFALAASRREQDNSQTGASECSWYFVQFNFDNTMGVTLTILLHSAIVTMAELYVARSPMKDSTDQRLSIMEIISQCGSYGTPPNMIRWFVQVIEWICSVVVARSITGGFVILLANVLLTPLAEFVDEMFGGYHVLHLYFILVVYPMCCSTTVAWILDGLLKKKQETVEQTHGTTELEPLICVSTL
eukprot:g7102.t1